MKSPGGGWPKKNNKIKDVLAKFNSQERKMYCFMHALFYKDYTWHIHRVVTKGWEQGIFPSFSGFPIIWQLLFRFFAKCPCPARAFLVTFCRLNETSLDLFSILKWSCVKISPCNKQSFRWHQLDLHKSQFYNSQRHWAVFSNEHGEWKVT